MVPEARRGGVGSALLAEGERLARAAGRTQALSQTTFAMERADGGGSPGMEFARARGFQIGLGDVQRVLDLPLEAGRLDRLVAQAAAYHDGYRFETYRGALPDELLRPIWELRGAVASEAPTGDIERTATPFDADAVAADAVELEAAGRERVTCVALAPSGEVAGYTDLVLAEHDPDWVYQWGTLVWRAHRGHRLGLALKVRNAAYLQRLLDEEGRHPRAIRTWNAESNSAMVGVNEAMGFRAVNRMAELHKSL